MIVGTFILLWTPGIISMLIIAVTGNRDFYNDILRLTAVLVHLNAALDPIIYAYRMNNIREALKKICSGSERSDYNNNLSIVKGPTTSSQSFKMTIA